MNISMIKVAWKYIWGGIGSVADYLLDLLNGAIAALDPAKKDRIQATLNVAQKVLSVLTAMRCLCPVRWQTAYGETLDAVNAVVSALDDLQITAEELERVRKEFGEAVAVWKAPDDETCVE